MNTKVFISKPGRGWSEIEIPGKLKNSSIEKIGNWAQNLVINFNYKGFLITENPKPYPIVKSN